MDVITSTLHNCFYVRHCPLNNCLKMSVFKGADDIHSQSIEQMQKHPIYWFDDGSLILEVQDIQFRVHHSHFQCHSSFLASAKPFIPSCSTNSMVSCTSQVLLCGIDRGFRSRDVEALLEHIYDDM